jgi:hypothetical protein
MCLFHFFLFTSAHSIEESPGGIMPHVGFLFGKPIHERSRWELITGFVIGPAVIAIALLSVVGWMTYHHHAEFSRGDWFGVGWAFFVAIVLVIGLPVTAWREWQRRKQFGNSEHGG